MSGRLGPQAMARDHVPRDLLAQHPRSDHPALCHSDRRLAHAMANPPGL